MVNNSDEDFDVAKTKIKLINDIAKARIEEIVEFALEKLKKSNLEYRYSFLIDQLKDRYAPVAHKENEKQIYYDYSSFGTYGYEPYAIVPTITIEDIKDFHRVSFPVLQPFLQLQYQYPYRWHQCDPWKQPHQRLTYRQPAPVPPQPREPERRYGSHYHSARCTS